MSKPWTKCVHAKGVWYTANLAQFARDNGVEKTRAYSIRKGKPGFKSSRGWTFELVEGNPPDGAKVWESRNEADNIDLGYVAPRQPNVPISEVFPSETMTPPPSTETQMDETLATIASSDITAADIEAMKPLEKYRLLSTYIMDMSLKTVAGAAEYPTGWRPKDLTSVLDSYAKSWNIDPKKAMDMRSDAEKVADGCVELLLDGTKIFELIDSTIDGLEKGFLDIYHNAEQYFEKVNAGGARADSLLRTADLIKTLPGSEPGDPPDPKS